MEESHAPMGNPEVDAMTSQSMEPLDPPHIVEHSTHASNPDLITADSTSLPIPGSSEPHQGIPTSSSHIPETSTMDLSEPQSHQDKHASLEASNQGDKEQMSSHDQDIISSSSITEQGIHQHYIPAAHESESGSLHHISSAMPTGLQDIPLHPHMMEHSQAVGLPDQSQSYQSGHPSFIHFAEPTPKRRRGSQGASQSSGRPYDQSASYDGSAPSYATPLRSSTRSFVRRQSTSPLTPPIHLAPAVEHYDAIVDYHDLEPIPQPQRYIQLVEQALASQERIVYIPALTMLRRLLKHHREVTQEPMESMFRVSLDLCKSRDRNISKHAMVTVREFAHSYTDKMDWNTIIAEFIDRCNYTSRHIRDLALEILEYMITISEDSVRTALVHMKTKNRKVTPYIAYCIQQLIISEGQNIRNHPCLTDVVTGIADLIDSQDDYMEEVRHLLSRLWDSFGDKTSFIQHIQTHPYPESVRTQLLHTFDLIDRPTQESIQLASEVDMSMFGDSLDRSGILQDSQDAPDGETSTRPGNETTDGEQDTILDSSQILETNTASNGSVQIPPESQTQGEQDQLDNPPDLQGTENGNSDSNTAVGDEQNREHGSMAISGNGGSDGADEATGQFAGAPSVIGDDAALSLTTDRYLTTEHEFANILATELPSVQTKNTNALSNPESSAEQ